MEVDKQKLSDVGTVIVKGVVGGAVVIVTMAHPMAAIITPFVQEAIGATLPSLRLRRIEKMLVALEEKMAQQSKLVSMSASMTRNFWICLKTDVVVRRGQSPMSASNI